MEKPKSIESIAILVADFLSEKFPDKRYEVRTDNRPCFPGAVILEANNGFLGLFARRVARVDYCCINNKTHYCSPISYDKKRITMEQLRKITWNPIMDFLKED
jgi:hypothetical protein